MAEEEEVEKTKHKRPRGIYRGGRQRCCTKCVYQAVVIASDIYFKYVDIITKKKKKIKSFGVSRDGSIVAGLQHSRLH